MTPTPPLREVLRRSDGRAVRLAARAGALTDHTSGLAAGFVQGNLVIVPRVFADDFFRFCQRNPKPCPILGITEPGSPRLPALADDFDIRTDVPRYRVWRDGKPVDDPTDIVGLWQDDFVAFVLGCSFTFEAALLDHGLSVRHIEIGCNVPMYRTSLACEPAGPFHGPMVVSMRPFRPADAIRAVQVTSRFPAVHGAPVHLGFPEAIGIADLARPDYGEAVPVAEDELPVFWACGVTPQAVAETARLPLAITHAPGCMVVTDLRNTQLSIL